LRPLFRNDIEQQGKKLMISLRFIVDTLETPQAMVPALESLGRRHVTYGVREEHYKTVGAALLNMLEHTLGAAFTSDARAAWTTAYTSVADIMKRAAATVASIDSQDQLSLARPVRSA
jgi:hemoglobin-like flavoprotein